MINRFYSQRLSARWRAAGIRNAGIMFVLPLSPKFLAFSYDGDVYTCDGRINGIVPTEKTSDVEALNLLQFMKASESIYFANWADGEKIRVAFEAAVHKRPAAWHKLHFAVKDEAAPEAESTR
jgi:hypothetical protein